VIAQNHPEIHLLEQRIRPFKFFLELEIVYRANRMRIDIVAQAQHKVAPLLLAHLVHGVGDLCLCLATFSHIPEGNKGDRSTVAQPLMHVRQEHCGGDRT
jgi:hypothetical protein